MKKLLLIIFILISTKNFSQMVVGFPETSEVDGWHGNSWVFSFKTTYTFNSNCFPTTIFAQYIFEGELKDASLTTLTYIPETLLIRDINQEWDDDKATWVNSKKTEYTYDEGRFTQSTVYDWINDVWQLSGKTVFSFDSSGLSTGLLSQHWDNINGVWENVFKTEILNDSEGRAEITTSFNWNSNTMDWDNDSRKTGVYVNSTNLYSSATTEKWNNNQWENEALETNLYDTDNHLVEYLLAIWDTTSKRYINNIRILYTNNSGGHPTTTIGQSWNSSTNSWLSFSRDRRTYPDCLTLSILDFENVDVKIFPNPTMEYIFISTITKANYSLFNINGKLIKKGTLTQGDNTVNLSFLSKGLYFIKIETNKGKSTKKIIKN